MLMICNRRGESTFTLRGTQTQSSFPCFKKAPSNQKENWLYRTFVKNLVITYCLTGGCPAES